MCVTYHQSCTANESCGSHNGKSFESSRTIATWNEDKLWGDNKTSNTAQCCIRLCRGPSFFLKSRTDQAGRFRELRKFFFPGDVFHTRLRDWAEFQSKSRLTTTTFSTTIMMAFETSAALPQPLVLFSLPITTCPKHLPRRQGSTPRRFALLRRPP